MLCFVLSTARRLISNRLARAAKGFGIPTVITGSADTGVSMGELAITLRNMVNAVPKTSDEQ